MVSLDSTMISHFEVRFDELAKGEKTKQLREYTKGTNVFVSDRDKCHFLRN